MGMYATTTGMAVKMVGTVFDSATTSLASACIYDAENEIKKQLGKRYDVSSAYFQTTTSIPPIIRSLAETLAIGYMYEFMARGSKEGHARADRYIKRVMENLKSIAEGTLQVTDTAGAALTGNPDEWKVHSNTTDYSNTFNEDAPANWEVDPDKLEDIESERD